MKAAAWLVSFMLAFSACTLPATGRPTAPSVTAASTGMTPTLTTVTQNVIRVTLHARGSSAVTPETTAGEVLTLEAAFEPVTQVLRYGADGRVSSVSTSPWRNAPVAKMRWRLVVGSEPGGLDEWHAYQPTIERDVVVDWLGTRMFLLQVEFSDAAGQTIMALASGDSVAQPQALAALTVRASLDPHGPLDPLPEAVQTAAAATRGAFPVSGSVQIEDGRCCAGGPAGAHVTLRVAFAARSSAAMVTEMRVQTGQCVREPAQMKGEWQPFEAQRSYDAQLALNWVGWWISVQYRDALGNLSPVYCDDISLEGSPPQPKP